MINMERPYGMDGRVCDRAISMDTDSGEADEEHEGQAATSHGRLRNASDHGETPRNDSLVEELTSVISGDENAQPLPEVDAASAVDADGDLVSGRPSIDDAVAVAVSVGGADGDVELLAEELAAIRSVLASSVSVDADDELLQRIRAWSDRIRPTEGHAATASTPVLATPLIPMTPPSESYPAASEETEWRVVDFDDGVYRGQVKRVVDVLAASSEGEGATRELTERFVPHGWGVVTSHKGLRRVGAWNDGEQISVGSLQSAVFLYDGEWHATKGPSGYGIGTFAFGVTFVGSWMNGRPYGLGRLYCAETRTKFEGWFHGTRCLQPVDELVTEQLQDALLHSHLPLQEPTEQPHRGLFGVGEILEEARLVSLQRALTQWRRVACEEAVAMAKAKRMEAIHAWAEAHTAERHAIAWDMAYQVQCHRERTASMLLEIEAGREKHNRVQRVRDFHTNRLETSIFQRDLARRCVLSQEESITLMEAELAQVTVLLEEATQAQADCKTHSHHHQHIKRQIENASVKINALKHQLRMKVDGEDSQRFQREQQDAARRKIKTPATPAYAKAIHGPRNVKMTKPNSEQDEELPFVCDAPGCSCGIPRDVFLRVAGAINGE